MDATTAAGITATQTKTLYTVLPLMVLAPEGEISEYEARTNGANLASLRALVRKGVLIERRGPFLMPAGPYTGQTLTESFYSAA